MSEAPLLAVRRLTVRYPLRRWLPWQGAAFKPAVDGLNFNLHAGETLGIVGESGCGKSSLARALVGLAPISAGAALYRQGTTVFDLAKLNSKQWKPLRRDIQMVFQDPLASLDPKMTVARIVEQPLIALCPELDKAQRAHRVAAMLERVGLDAADGAKRAREFSGGQCQRIGIARALVVQPKLLILDEPVSALDVSVQAQIVNLLSTLQRDLGLTLIFIAHDLAVVRLLSPRVLVMYAGQIVEQAPREPLFRQPLHPYTQTLLAALPGISEHAEAPPAVVADDPHITFGCRYRSRCAIADDICGREAPALRRVGEHRYAACHFIAPELA